MRQPYLLLELHLQQNGTICKGLFVYAQFNPGNGGYTNATDEFQYSINGGSTWTNYTPGASINTATATTSVQVRARRLAGLLSACNTTAWSTLVTSQALFFYCNSSYTKHRNTK